MAPTASPGIITLTFTLGLMFGGCASTSTTVLSPSPVAARCGIAMGLSGSSFAASGGTGTLTVEAARECAWSVSERPAWMALSAVPNTQGALEVSFAIEPNRSTHSRSADLVIADQRARISQEAATCSWAITPSTISLAASGSDVRARLSTEDFCSWEARSPAPWIVVTPVRGEGSADITFEVRANAGEKRSGQLQVGGAVVAVEQRQAPLPPPVPQAPPTPSKVPPPAVPEPELPPSQPPAPIPPVIGPSPAPPPVVPAACTFTVSPLKFELSRKSKHVDVSVVTQPSCELRARSSALWVEVSPTIQTGSGKLRLDIDENRGRDSRTSEVTLTGPSFTATVVVTQKGAKRDDDEEDDDD